MDPFEEYVRYETRHQFFGRGADGVGRAALASLMVAGRSGRAAESAGHHAPGPHFAPKAKHVIYLHMVGGPSQMDLYDY